MRIEDFEKNFRNFDGNLTNSLNLIIKKFKSDEEEIKNLERYPESSVTIYNS